MTISYSISNTTNFTQVGFADPQTSFPTIIGNATFGYTVTFSSSFPLASNNIIETIVVSSPNETNVAVLSENSVRITRNTNVTVFPNESFIFVEFDANSQKTFTQFGPQQANQASQDSSVIQWTEPSAFSINTSYSFILKYDDSTERSVSFSQELRWHWTPVISQVADLVSNSRW
jgi:hypothetical protein